MHLVGDGFVWATNILARIASGSNEVFLFSRWGIWVFTTEATESYRARVLAHRLHLDGRQHVKMGWDGLVEIPDRTWMSWVWGARTRAARLRSSGNDHEKITAKALLFTPKLYAGAYHGS